MGESFDGFYIRPMVEKDLDQVCEIEKTLFSRPWSKNDFFGSINDDSDIYLVVELDEEIVGYCGLWSVLEEGQINNVAIKKEYQSHGLGYKMLDQLIKEGRSKGLTAFTLEVRVSNVKAIRLYQKLGFTEAGVRKNFYEIPKEDALIMWNYF
ncbi:ribosomal-protein-S18p-alanine acetyltransferase [Lachnospiraceae bacterium KM106-2]|nr:ribosomal-protein-S18p-alanine acetyltransferase [Lachnospiraceae bacterium KM106-2]